MSKGLGSTILKLLIASLLVGLVMHWFGATPRSLIANFGASVERIFDTLAGFAGWAVAAAATGAMLWRNLHPLLVIFAAGVVFGVLRLA